jgi:hypothetical protein
MLTGLHNIHINSFFVLMPENPAKSHSWFKFNQLFSTTPENRVICRFITQVLTLQKSVRAATHPLSVGCFDFSAPSAGAVVVGLYNRVVAVTGRVFLHPKFKTAATTQS